MLLPEVSADETCKGKEYQFSVCILNMEISTCKVYYICRINYPAAEQRGILKNIERPRGRGYLSAFYQPLAG